MDREKYYPCPLCLQGQYSLEYLYDNCYNQRLYKGECDKCKAIFGIRAGFRIFLGYRGMRKKAFGKYHYDGVDVGLSREETTGDYDKLQIIQEFATKLIENTEDINPKYAKLVNKHFWDLLSTGDNEKK